MGKVSQFLGIEFTWNQQDDGNINVVLTQQSFTEILLESLGYTTESCSTFTTPYRSGLSIDSIPTIDMSVSERDNFASSISP